MDGIEKRIERLEDYVPEKPGKWGEYVSLLSSLRGFWEKHGLGDNPSEEEVQEVLDRISNRRRLYDKH